MLNRLYSYWVYGGALAGVLLVLLAPLLVGLWPTALMFTFLLLPIYMFHQYEEHDDDRFRRFVNNLVGKGKEILSPAACFIINIPGVWGVIAISLYLACYINVGFGLIAVYLMLVNAVAHVVHAIIFRSYNPGLITAIFLFFPFGFYTLWQIQQAGGGTLLFNGIGFLVAIVLHDAMILYALRRRSLLLKRSV
jgi:hypothetical protein